MPRFKDSAICIRDLDWSESSQVVVLLTEGHGKLRGLAKGSKRQSPSSVQRFSGGIELLTAGEVVATTRPSSELAAITEWNLQSDYFPLRRHLAAQRTAMFAADVVNALLADADPHPGMFAALRRLLDALCAEARGAADLDAALLTFQWAVLVDAGYRPEFERDVQNGGPLKSATTYSFDPVAGGLTSDSGVADWRVRSSTVQTLRTLAKGDRPTDAEAIGRANRLLCVYLRAILDRELPTMSLLLGNGR